MFMVNDVIFSKVVLRPAGFNGFCCGIAFFGMKGMTEVSTKNTALFLRVIATLAFVAMVVVNALANGLPINGLTTGEVSDLYPNLFTPAGITFSIWSVIYLFLFAFVINTWVRRDDVQITQLLPAFVMTCIFNLTWIVVWHNLLPGLSVVIMLLLLGTLVLLFLRIQHTFQRNKANIFLVSVPFSIYLAWICVATIANISAWLVSFNADEFFISGEAWTLIMMTLAAGIGVLVLLKYQVPEFVAVIAWALTGIFLRWNGSDQMAIQYVSLGLVVALIAFTSFLLVRKNVHASE